MIGTSALVMTWTAAPVHAQTQTPRSPAIPAGLDPDVVQLMQRVLATQDEPVTRRAAATALLQDRRSDAVSGLVWLITQSNEPQAWRTVAQAILIHPMDPLDDSITRNDARIVAALWSRLSLIDGHSAGNATAATAVGGDDESAASLRAASLDAADVIQDALIRLGPAGREGDWIAAMGRTDVSEAVRARAAMVLAGADSPTAARALISALGFNQPGPLRTAASEALERMTGLSYGLDDVAWRRWYDASTALGTDGWRRRLLRLRQESVQRNDATAQRLTARLLQANRAVYRSTPGEQRAELLASWLNDASPEVRGLAVGLCRQRISDGAAFDDELRVALRQRIEDQEVAIRRDATLVLADLSDEFAGEMAARRLLTRAEPDPRVIEASLVLLSRAPRPSAVGPALNLLVEDTFRPAAARVLQASAQEGQLTRDMAAQARDVLRDLVTDPQARTPEILSLLAQLGTETDWAVLSAWLEDPAPEVRRSAAAAWAEHDGLINRLAERAEDPAIQPALYTAVQGRAAGEDVEPAVLNAMIRHRPSDPSRIPDWSQAIDTSLSRLGPADQLAAIDRFQAMYDEPGRVALMIESAADAWDQQSATDALPEGSAPVPVVDLSAAELLLRRAEIRCGAGEYEAALTDVERISMESAGLAALSDRGTLVRTLCHFGQLEIEAALSLAVPVWQNWPSDVAAIDRFARPTLEAALNAAESLAATDRQSEAISLMSRIRLALSEATISPELTDRINAAADVVNQSIDVVPPAPSG